MQTERPLILILNDDGYHSPGIHTLVDMTFDSSDVLVCAPETARSSFSYASPAMEYLRLKHRKGIGMAQAWSCSSTSVDYVKLALDQLRPDRRPVLILGGTSHGDNSFVNNHHSGTMGIAMEGRMKYIPSMAPSSCYYKEDANLEPLCPYVRMVVKEVLVNGLPEGIYLNVNFPAWQVFEGIKMCRTTMGRWVNEIMKQYHPYQYDYYWVAGEYQNGEPNAKDSDQWTLNRGYVAITSTKMDITAYEFMNKVREWEKPVTPSVFNA